MSTKSLQGHRTPGSRDECMTLNHYMFIVKVALNQGSQT